MARTLLPCGHQSRDPSRHVCDNAHTPHTHSLAWEGDALHRLDVVRRLRDAGFTPACSHNRLVALISGEAQANYVRVTYQPNGNDRFLSTLFEALYVSHPPFRQRYLDHLHALLPLSAGAPEVPVHRHDI